MKSFTKTHYGLVLGLIASLLLGLLILYLVLAMMSVTSGVSRTINPVSRDVTSATFNIEAASSLGLE